MSVTSGPSNGAGGVFAFEEEPGPATGVVGRPALLLSAADAAHRRHAEALSGNSSVNALPQQLPHQQPPAALPRR